MAKPRVREASFLFIVRPLARLDCAQVWGHPYLFIAPMSNKKCIRIAWPTPLPRLYTAPMALAWLRRDLRAQGNPLLEDGALPVYVHDPSAAGDWAPGGASAWWLARSLEALARYLPALRVLPGPAEEVLPRLAAEVGARAVRYTPAFEPWRRAEEARVLSALARAGVAAVPTQGAYLFAPGSVVKADGTPYRVFTPFYKACVALLEVPGTAPPRCADGQRVPRAGAEDVSFVCPPARWQAKLAQHWTPGESGARAALARFTQGPLPRYAADRNRLDIPDAASRLSPHLAWGEISPQEILTAVWGRPGAEAFIRQLIWREFAAQMLWHFPDMPAAPLQPAFARFPWARDEGALEAWRRGRTGEPLVDTAMAELWETGTMHNRARMVVASFLTKNLLQPWQDGQRWFWDTLVDADLANNAFGWQWVAGCGADAAPYFRIFNPRTQAEKFDPTGAYRDRWAPALSPPPLVDLAASRARALAAYQDMRA
jgi:deoxyribodipyrimidine photo-lyase